MKILVVFGTRPEAIKMAPVVSRLRALKDKANVITCVTSQHREMLYQVLNLFEITPEYDLDIMREKQSLFDVSINAMKALEGVLKNEKPDLVLVQGDTTTAFIAGLAAYYSRVSIGHIEAGLRTWDKYSPFPEEINRKLIDAISDLLFAATEEARKNLLEEGIDDGRIFVTGNTVIDALLTTREKVAGDYSSSIKDSGLFDETLFKRIMDPNNRIILVTGHRRESFGTGFENICNGLKEIALNFEDIDIIYPVHLNPNVQDPTSRILGDVSRVHLIEPMEYASFVWLMDKSHFILTDSGGIQEEAPSLGKPVLVMREKTERPEAISAGTSILVGTASESIYQGARSLLGDESRYAEMAHKANPYGDGRASEKIVDLIFHYLQGI